MKSMLTVGAAIGALIPAWPGIAAAAPALDDRFGDHMVVQRGEPVTVSGTASPRERLTVRLGDAETRVRANRQGRWSAELPAMEAGGEPLTLEVTSEEGSARAEDVLVGDVWLCSGQSNMEYPVYRALNPDRELGADHAEDIRLLTVPKAAEAAPAGGFAEEAPWQVASAESLRDFSAVCYFMARDIHEEIGVPLGLIDASWGGSQIEAWIGADGLREVGGFDDGLDLLEEAAEDMDAAMATFGEKWEAWWNGVADEQPWSVDAHISDWSAVPDGMGDWKAFGDPELADHLGMVWFRNEFELSAEQADAPATLALGGIDEIDSVWVNGRFIGNTFGWGTPREYSLPEGVLREGGNSVTVSVYNGWGAGGMTGPADAVGVAFEGAERMPLSGGWRYEKVPAEYGAPLSAPWQSVSGLAGMANGMIAPLEGARLKGAIWYQGESNAGRADEYQALLAGLVDDWRDRFGEDLPVVVVQLPNFGALATEPADSGWAGIREAERQVALDDENVGVVVTIDAGDRFDIHPPNKQVVAQRAAQVALALAYQGDAVTDGYSPEGAELSADTVTIRYGEDSPLHLVGSDRAIGFALCDDDGACRYADARLNAAGNALMVPVQEGPVSEVRYCWADAPICNVFTEGDVPVTPFSLPVGD
ncbi:sialate O-acetylesterase [Parvularcula oceani]|uniref:sialate O-acetylesterase n=1 Tax=Parvularcula oceani TaxID=1247963 RepID=UPI0004E0E41E|nr:sialate O-acetylesterase [Parvularcula oceani]